MGRGGGFFAGVMIGGLNAAWTNFASNVQDYEFSPFVDEEGNITRPTDYKTQWSHIGGFAVAKKEGD